MEGAIAKTQYVRNNFWILKKFYFSISKLFHFIFTSRSQVNIFHLHFSSEWHFYFTLHFSGEVKDICFHFSRLDCPNPTLIYLQQCETLETLSLSSRLRTNLPNSIGLVLWVSDPDHYILIKSDIFISPWYVYFLKFL